jgi:hypothetical protein
MLAKNGHLFRVNTSDGGWARGGSATPTSEPDHKPWAGHTLKRHLHAEDQGAVLSLVREKANEMDPRKVSRAVSLYGKSSTRKRFRLMLRDGRYNTSLDVFK